MTSILVRLKVLWTPNYYVFLEKLPIIDEDGVLQCTEAPFWFAPRAKLINKNIFNNKIYVKNTDYLYDFYSYYKYYSSELDVYIDLYPVLRESQWEQIGMSVESFSKREIAGYERVREEFLKYIPAEQFSGVRRSMYLQLVYILLFAILWMIFVVFVAWLSMWLVRALLSI